MIEVAGLDAAGTAAAASARVRAQIVAGCENLEFAAHWADLHPGDGLDLRERIDAFGAERVQVVGGEGTPEVAECALAEFGLEVGFNPYQARSLIADALDLRHRLPLTWAKVRLAQVPPQSARQLAFRTRALTAAQAAEVDARLAGKLATLTVGRLEKQIDAALLRVDQEAREREAEKALRARFARIGAVDEHGMINFWARMAAPDAVRADAAVDRLADILMARADDLPAGVPVRGAVSKEEWRSVAHALSTSNPVLASKILIEQQQPNLFNAEAPDSDRSVSEAIGQIDATELAPSASLHVHINAEAFRRSDPAADHQVARIEELGAALLSTVRCWLGDGTVIKLQPIVDPTDVHPVDGYEVPDRMRDALLARTPASVFPWSGSLNRHNDRDHTIEYRPPPDGPPGQTGMHNLGPLARSEHRYKTFGRVRVRQPVPGSYVWRTRFGRVLITNDSGTHDLGNSRFARAVWAAATVLTAEHDDGSMAEALFHTVLATAA